MIRTIAAATALLALCGAGMVRADNTTTPPDSSAAPSGSTDTSNLVFVGGTPILRVLFGAGGYTPEERAEHIQNRVNMALSHGPVKASDITVQAAGSDAVVLVSGNLLFTADVATAHANHSSPMTLASEWADHMRQVLPDLTAAK
jgi:hypothetical protein